MIYRGIEFVSVHFGEEKTFAIGLERVVSFAAVIRVVTQQDHNYTLSHASSGICLLAMERTH